MKQYKATYNTAEDYKLFKNKASTKKSNNTGIGV